MYPCLFIERKEKMKQTLIFDGAHIQTSWKQSTYTNNLKVTKRPSVANHSSGQSQTRRLRAMTPLW